MSTGDETSLQGFTEARSNLQSVEQNPQDYHSLGMEMQHQGVKVNASNVAHNRKQGWRNLPLHLQFTNSTALS